MASLRRNLITLLASPPALRAEFYRSICGECKTRSLTTIKSGDLATKNIYRYPALLTRRAHTSQKRFQSTTTGASASVTTANLTSTSISSSNLDNSAATPRRRSRLARILTTSSLILVFFAAGFSMAATPVAEAANGFLNPPTDAETLQLFEPSTPNAAEINAHIVNHPLAKRLRAQESMTESRPHLRIPPAMRAHNLTAGTLLGENKIEVPPLTFNEKDAELPSLVQMSYLGPALCGHPGIVHGGMLATMLDEGLARTCFPALPNKVGVTASLKIDYRMPCPGSSYVVLKAETIKVEGRKAWVKGWIELLGEEDGTGVKLVEAEALFIEPKQAKSMARVYSSQ